MTERGQMRGLIRLARLLRQKEINFAICPGRYRDKDGRIVTDMCFLTAVDTPNASEIVYDEHNGQYDVWTVRDGRYHLQSSVNRKEAAKLVITEYFWAKAARIKQAKPDANITQLLEKLDRGYQRGQSGK